MAEQIHLITQVDVITGSVKELYRGSDADIANLTFQSAVMEPNVRQPTPFLYEIQRGNFLIQRRAVIFLPGEDDVAWKENQVVEKVYQEVWEALKSLSDVVHGYTHYGDQELKRREDQ